MSQEVCLVLLQTNVLPRILLLQKGGVDDDLIHTEPLVVQCRGCEMQGETHAKNGIVNQP